MPSVTIAPTSHSTCAIGTSSGAAGMATSGSGWLMKAVSSSGDYRTSLCPVARSLQKVCQAVGVQIGHVHKSHSRKEELLARVLAVRGPPGWVHGLK
jgi:hypothetical protein